MFYEYSLAIERLGWPCLGFSSFFYRSLEMHRKFVTAILAWIKCFYVVFIAFDFFTFYFDSPSSAVKFSQPGWALISTWVYRSFLGFDNT